MDEDFDKVEWHLKRAAQIRVMSEAAKGRESRNLLLQMAEDYQRLAAARAGRPISK